MQNTRKAAPPLKAYGLGLAALAALELAAAPAARAAVLDGTSVTGALTFNSDPTNNFAPGNGNNYVPAGYGNSSSDAVTISDTQTEFGYDDGGNRDTTDFTDAGLTIQDVSANGHNSDTTYSFTDTAFSGGKFLPVSNSFNGGTTYSLTGDTFAFFDPGANDQGTLRAVFGFTPAPGTPAPCRSLRRLPPSPWAAWGCSASPCAPEGPRGRLTTRSPDMKTARPPRRRPGHLHFTVGDTLPLGALGSPRDRRIHGSSGATVIRVLPELRPFYESDPAGRLYS